ALEQMRKRGAHGVQRPFHVDVDHLLEEVGRELEEGTISTDAGVRDEDVQPAEGAHGRGHDLLHLSGIANVARLRDRARNAEVVATARGKSQLHTLLREPSCDRGPDAAACPGDEGNLSVERRHASSKGRRAGYSSPKRL